jgi:hypothetical protein
MEANAIEQERRNKRAKMLRYVRKSRGEEVEEEPQLAAMSVEERDRAETIAKHEVALATGEAGPQPQANEQHTPAAEKAGKEMAAREADEADKEKQDS